MSITFRDRFMTPEIQNKELMVLNVKATVIQNADICPFTHEKKTM